MLDQLQSLLEIINRQGLTDKLMDGVLERTRDHLEYILTDRRMIPKERAKYVGVEIEFLSKYKYNEIFEDFLNEGLGDYVVLGYDFSVNGNGTGYELKVLAKEKEIDKIIIKVCDVLKQNKARVNDSCGLHVHMDCRYRNRKIVFNNFLKAQKLLYKMTTPEREDGCYSQYNNEIDPCTDSAHSYGVENSNFNTVEIRIHHGTVNAEVIKNWIKMLITIANKKNIYKAEQLRNESNIVNSTSFPKSIKRYIKRKLDKTG